MKRFGLIGYPIGHSLSPSLFNAAYGGKYAYDLIECSDFEEAFNIFLEGYDGINVTSPFKEKAFRKADFPSRTCRITGATNLMVKRNDGIHAYNTDFLAVRRILAGIQEASGKKQTVHVLGCGGAGKAAACAAAEMGFEVHIYNRSIDKASEFAERLAGEFGSKVIPAGYDSFVSVSDTDILIDALPASADISHVSDILSACPDDKRPAVIEADYRSPRLLLPGGDRYVSGKKWLEYQAVEGYAIFTGEDPSEKDIAMIINC